MAAPFNASRLLITFCLSAAAVGCGGVPMSQYRAAQYQNLQTYRQLAQVNQSASQIVAEKQQLEQMAGQLQQELAVAQGELSVTNERLANLSSERQELTTRYASLLSNLNSVESPLGGSATKRFEELARKYPEFEFDPYTGVSKFTGDLLFSSGSDLIRTEGQPLLQEFARIMNDTDARQFNILVVGHTDDRPISRKTTKDKHSSNWELSAHRATSVVEHLAKHGLAENRLGIAGYSMFQPVAPNASDATRQQNRRVEIYIMAPDALVAGLDQPRPYF